MSRAWVPSLEGVHTIESPAPSPEPHEVVVAVEAAQLAHAQPYRHGAVPGLAAVGRVVAVGEQALALLDQRVLVGAVDPCGQCEVCRRGGGTVCPHAHHRGSDGRGTLAERITVAARWVVPLGGELGLDPGGSRTSPGATPGEILAPASPSPGGAVARSAVDRGAAAVRPASGPADQCALAAVPGDAALAYTTYARSDLAPREPVVVLGCAPVTRFLIEILLAKGLFPVVLLDPLEIDEHGYDRSDFGWRGWLGDRGVATVQLDTGADLDEMREHIEAALARREGAGSAGPPGDGSTSAAASGSASDATSSSTSAAGSPASAAASPTQAGRPWKLIATEPRHLLLATRLAGPRAQVTAVVPPILPAAIAPPRPALSALGGSADLLGSLMAGAAEDAQRPADPLQTLSVDPTAWTREVIILGVTAASPELILETAALVVRGQLDLDAGTAVVDLGDLDPASVAALGSSRSLIVRVPQARS